MDFLTREFMLMLLYLAVGRLLASHADVLRGSSRVFFPTNGRKRVGKEMRDEPLRTSAWEARRLLEVCYHGYECLTDPRLYKAHFREL